ncbi:hypothetical protein PVAG01_06839 [Phlyctema vagabunda]|uniref:Aminoglycoside phosphotransferase domain-containing protein n=1 Tax=Phlyctema vagabunda TaxID=108571 RepID=A0ABR4PH70_9HELO
MAPELYNKLEQAIIRDDFAHPERFLRNLQLKRLVPIEDVLCDYKSENIGEPTEGFGEPLPDLEPLCWVCGWTKSDQEYCSYASRIRIHQTSGHTGLWEVGHRWMIWDRPKDHLRGYDFLTQNFLRTTPGLETIPLVKEMRLLSEPEDKVELVLMSRARGELLWNAWSTLDEAQKESLRREMAGILRALRQFTSPVAQTVDGSPVADHIITPCHHMGNGFCRNIGPTHDEWLESIKADLLYGIASSYNTEDHAFVEAKFEELKRNLPPSEPYVLTHGDLNPSNIFIKDGKIEAIIDWQYAAYMPWWMERYICWDRACGGSSELFSPMWRRMRGEMDETTFLEKVFEPVQAIKHFWQMARPTRDEDGSKSHDRKISDPTWWRPAFCACKRITGKFDNRYRGNKWTHITEDYKQNKKQEERIELPRPPPTKEFLEFEVMRRKAEAEAEKQRLVKRAAYVKLLEDEKSLEQF